MGYIVRRDFSDLRDNEHIYRVGDKYPRDGIEVDEERVKVLASTSNRIGEPLIEETVEKPKRRRK